MDKNMQADMLTGFHKEWGGGGDGRGNNSYRCFNPKYSFNTENKKEKKKKRREKILQRSLYNLGENTTEVYMTVQQVYPTIQVYMTVHQVYSRSSKVFDSS